jgi:hypothetical protein
MFAASSARTSGWRALVFGSLFVALLMPMQPSCAADGLEILSSFTGGDAQLKIAVYTEGDQTVGLIGAWESATQNGQLKVSFTFTKQEMDTFIALVQKALQIQSAQWQQAGSMDETGTSSPSHVVVYGGPSLQFAVTDPSKGSVTFVLASSDEAALVNALNQAEGRLSE